MDKEQLRHFVADNSGLRLEGSVMDAIMDAIDQYKDACIEDALRDYVPIMPGVVGYPEKQPTLIPLKWKEDEGACTCPASRHTYWVFYSKDGKWEAEFREDISWAPIGNNYDTEEEAREACERHRNQWLKGFLQ